MKWWLFVFACLFSFPVAAEPMKFETNATGGNHCCNWIQAAGEITEASGATLEQFFKATEFVPHVIRLNSPGGSLFGGILLGQTIRKLGLTTEVGSSAFDPNFSVYSQEPGICASACAYAFLGGNERSLDAKAKLGFHRFYTADALASSTSKIFSGEDLDATQRIAAALLLYVVNMGVDARLLALASQAGPNEIRWLQPEEATELRVTYAPRDYKPWRIEPYQNGAIAVSESNDGYRSIVAGCSSRSGPYVALIDSSPDVDEVWLNQCRVTGNLQRVHPVFGTIVQPSQVILTHRKTGGVVMRFPLPTRTPPLTTPQLFTFQGDYPMACSTNVYQASSVNFISAVRLALRNCYE